MLRNGFQYYVGHFVTFGISTTFRTLDSLFYVGVLQHRQENTKFKTISVIHLKVCDSTLFENFGTSDVEKS